MYRHLFSRLRRCRAVFALALCAWLALASVASAVPDHCCDAMTGTMAPDHAHAHPATPVPDSCCAHASVSVQPSLVAPVQFAPPGSLRSQARREAAPQPVYEPPLRPPVA